MKVGRIKDPLYKDYYLGISHLPSPHLLRIPRVVARPVDVQACMSTLIERTRPESPIITPLTKEYTLNHNMKAPLI